MTIDHRLGDLKYVETDPTWFWALDPDNYAHKLKELELSEEQYVAAWAELLDVFPLAWARKGVVSDNSYVSWEGIHPYPFSRLSFHPLANLLGHKPFGGWRQAVHALRLGLDLLETRSIPRIKALRSELRSLDQYEGRLLELEALADFSRRGLDPQIIGTPDFLVRTSSGGAVYIEARHRGVPFWMEVAHGIHGPWADDWPGMRVNLKYASGVRREARELSVEITEAIERLTMPGATSARVERDRYEVFVDGGSERKTIVIGYGPDRAWNLELEDLVFQTLIDKSSQLRDIAGQGHPTAVLLDCRALLHPEGYDPIEQRAVRRQEHMNAILRAGARFLSDHAWVTGVVWTWGQLSWRAPHSEILRRPLRLTVSTRIGHSDRLAIESLCREAQ